MLKKSYTSILVLSLLFLTSGALAADKLALKCTMDPFYSSNSSKPFKLGDRTYVFNFDSGMVYYEGLGGDGEHWTIVENSEEYLRGSSSESEFKISRTTGKITHGRSNGTCQQVDVKKF